MFFYLVQANAIEGRQPIGFFILKNVVEAHPFRNQLSALDRLRPGVASSQLYQPISPMDDAAFTPLCHRLPRNFFVWLMAEGNEKGYSSLYRGERVPAPQTRQKPQRPICDPFNLDQAAAAARPALIEPTLIPAFETVSIEYSSAYLTQTEQFFGQTTPTEKIRAYFSKTITNALSEAFGNTNALQSAKATFEVNGTIERVRTDNSSERSAFFCLDVELSNSADQTTWLVFGGKSYFYLTQTQAHEPLTIFFLKNVRETIPFREQLLNLDLSVPDKHKSDRLYLAPYVMDRRDFTGTCSQLPTSYPIWLFPESFAQLYLHGPLQRTGPAPLRQAPEGNAEQRPPKRARTTPTETTYFGAVETQDTTLGATEFPPLSELPLLSETESSTIVVVFDDFFPFEGNQVSHGDFICQLVLERAKMSARRIYQLPIFWEPNSEFDFSAVKDSLGLLIQSATQQPKINFILVIAWDHPLDDEDCEVAFRMNGELNALQNLLILIPGIERPANFFPHMLSQSLGIGAWNEHGTCPTTPYNDSPSPVTPRMEWQRIPSASGAPRISEAIARRAGAILSQEPNFYRALCGKLENGRLHCAGVTQAQWPQIAQFHACSFADYLSAIPSDAVLGVPHGATQIFIFGDEAYTYDVVTAQAKGPFERHIWEANATEPNLHFSLYFSDATPWKMETTVLAVMVRTEGQFESPIFAPVTGSAEDGMRYYVHRLFLRDWHYYAATSRLVGHALVQYVLKGATEELPDSVKCCAKVRIDADRHTLWFQFDGNWLGLTSDNRLVTKSEDFDEPEGWSPSAPSPFEIKLPQERSGRTNIRIIAESFELNTVGGQAFEHFESLGVAHLTRIRTSAQDFDLVGELKAIIASCEHEQRDTHAFVVLMPIEIDSLSDMEVVARLSLPGNIWTFFPGWMKAQCPRWTFPHCVQQPTTMAPGESFPAAVARLLGLEARTQEGSSKRRRTTAGQTYVPVGELAALDINGHPGSGVAHSRPVGDEFDSNSSTSIEPSGAYDVFVSYAWAQKEQVHALVDSLRKLGLSVWMDKSHISGILYTAINKAIINSRVVMVFVSDEYEISPNCSRELLRASELHKPLVVMRVGNYDIRGPRNFSSIPLLLAGHVYNDLDADGKLQDPATFMRTMESHGLKLSKHPNALAESTATKGASASKMSEAKSEPKKLDTAQLVPAPAPAPAIAPAPVPAPTRAGWSHSRPLRINDQAEFRRTKGLMNHRNVLSYSDSNFEPFVCTLEEKLAGGPPSFEQARQWIFEIAQGLHYLHCHKETIVALGFLSPKTIVLGGEDGQTIKLPHPGLLSASLDHSCSAPELKPPDLHTSADIYSFGMICSKLLELTRGDVRVQLSVSNLYALVARCRQRTHQKRPEISFLVGILPLLLFSADECNVIRRHQADSDTQDPVLYLCHSEDSMTRFSPKLEINKSGFIDVLERVTSARRVVVLLSPAFEASLACVQILSLCAYLQIPTVVVELEPLDSNKWVEELCLGRLYSPSEIEGALRSVRAGKGLIGIQLPAETDTQFVMM
eukprot:TRINITY_DN153_c1_g1_i14.p1 TRINITY_DN153_c1_g1~~TRINITY_DN153_c1_g1_i14.p1  ORF type:complete len:1645 (-),score=291.87 TRINITY_DN153_c1_g1_i14:57-4661(-)